MIVTYNSVEEWMAEGERLFGKDMLRWKFVCPMCGHIQTPEDFRQYKDKGSDPNSATSECIGRYTGAGDSINGSQPCNYAGYGLFRLSPVRVTSPEGKTETHCFGFYVGERREQASVQTSSRVAK